MRYFAAVLAVVLLSARPLGAQTIPADSPRFTVHQIGGPLQKVIDILQKTSGVVASYSNEIGYYHVERVWVDSVPIQEVMRQCLSGLPLRSEVRWNGGILFLDIYAADGKKSSPAGPDPAGVAQKRRNEFLPVDTVSKVIHNGLDPIEAAAFTGSSSVVQSANIEREVDPDLFAHLDGWLSGLTMGGPGNSLGFSVRGNSTLLGTGTPLLVIGKFAYPGNRGDIGPYDIKEATLLKDAVGAGVWGAYSGNGVLVLTPKEGAYDSPRVVTLITNFTVTGKPMFSYPSRMSPFSYIDADSLLFNAHFYDGYFGSPNFVLPPSVQLMWEVQQGSMSPAAANSAISAMGRHNIIQDLDRYYYRVGASQEYHLSIEGGTANSKYYIAGGYDRDPTNLVRNRFERSTVNFSYTVRSKDQRLEAAFSGNLVNVYTLNNNTGDVPVSYPYAALADASGRPLPVAYQYNPLFVDTISSSYPLDWHYRPLQELALSDNRSGRLNFYLENSLTFYLLKGLVLETSARWMHGHSYSRDDHNKDAFFVRDLVNSYSQLGEGGFSQPVPDGAILVAADTDYSAYNLRAKLKYAHTTASHNKWSVMAGAEVSDAETTGQTQRIYGHDGPTGSAAMNLVDPFTLRPSGASQPIPTNDALMALSNRALSVFSNFAYNWKHSYHFYSAFRLDASNIVGVPEERKWAPFWSVGFDKEQKGRARWGSLLKLRTSFGCNGNVSNKTANLETQFLGMNMYGAAQYGFAQYPDPTLGWERVYIFNPGLDYAFFRDSLAPAGRLSGSVDLYESWAVNLLSLDTLAPSAGVTSYFGNSAGIVGRGVELVLHSLNYRSRLQSFSWTSDLLLSVNRDRVSRYPYQPGNPSSYVTSSYLQRGKPSTALYSYGWAGLNPQTGDPRGWLNGVASSNYSDLMNNPGARMVYSGDWQPVVTASLLNSVYIGAWTISARLDCRTGYVVRRPSIEYYALAMNTYRGTRDYDDRWQYQGQQTSVPSMPSLTTMTIDRDLFYQNTQVLVVRADNIRWRDLNVSYDLLRTRRTWAKKKIKAAVVYVYANNIALLWKANHHGLNPDAALYGQMPAVRAYSIGTQFKI